MNCHVLLKVTFGIETFPAFHATEGLLVGVGINVASQFSRSIKSSLTKPTVEWRFQDMSQEMIFQTVHRSKDFVAKVAGPGFRSGSLLICRRMIPFSVTYQVA